jgi:hypothetical protein
MDFCTGSSPANALANYENLGELGRFCEEAGKVILTDVTSIDPSHVCPWMKTGTGSGQPIQKPKLF